MSWFDFLFHTQPFDAASVGGQTELILRLVLSCICGGIIGLERTRRLKDAGVRTHIVVALGSTLMMLVSKYGFFDVATGVAGLRLQADVSRIASQIVTGVGFLGAGIIFTKRGAVKGLTTAAGVWATAGIGMAIGAGMYLIGVVGAGIILLCQYLLHRILNKVEAIELIVKLRNSDEAVRRLKTELDKKRLHIEKFELNGKTDSELRIDTVLKVPENISVADVSLMFVNNADILSFTINNRNKDDE